MARAGQAGDLGAGGGAGGTVGGVVTTIGSLVCRDYWPPNPAGRVYRVSPMGDDANDCTDAHPCRTIQRASHVTTTPGSIVLVDDGTYDGFYVEHSGVWFRANGDNVVVNSSQDGVYGQTGDNINVEGTHEVIIEGFTVLGATRNGIRVVDSANVVVVGNRVSGGDNRGIFTGFAPGVRILNNEVSDSGGNGISITNSDAPDDDFVLCGNVVHHANAGVSVDADCMAGGDGVLESGVLFANLVYENRAQGIRLASAPGSQVSNNIVYQNGTSGGAAGIHLTNSAGCDVSYATSGARVFNNTVHEPNILAMRIGEGAGNATVFNNIFAGQPSPVADEVGSSDIATSNIVQQSLNGLNLTASYRLQTGSAALDVGDVSYGGVSAPAVDFDGTARPQRAGVDVGAHELQ